MPDSGDPGCGVQIMHTIFQVRFPVFIFLLVLGFGCNASNSEADNVDIFLAKAFNKIYLSTNGLEYPNTVRTLNHCIKYNDSECLESYNIVLSGRKMIRSVSSMKALETTLDIIERTCLSKDENLANNTCYGGIISLYFYTSSEQDAKILNRIKTYHKDILNIIFGSEFFWFYNRPNKDAWVNAISAMDIDWKNDIHKQITLNLFRKSIEAVKDKTWVSK